MEIKVDDSTISFIIFFVTPGFIAMQMYDLMVPSERRNFANSTAQMVIFSIINYLLTSTILEPLRTNALKDVPSFEWILTTFCVVIFAPAIEAILFVKIRKDKRLRGILIQSAPTAWDYFFGLRKECWIRCFMKSGKMIGGWYGENSTASTFPHPPQLYVETMWSLGPDGSFFEPINNSAGAVISMSDCELIEMIKDKKENK